MAKNGAFFKAAAEVHPKWHTPVVAIIAQGVCAMLMTLTPFPQLVMYIGFSLTCFTVMSVASLFVFRRKPRWQKLRPVSFAFPLVPGAYILVGAGMMFYGIIWQPKASLTALATIAAGAAVYHFGLRKNAGEV
jgi:APA family basic amino acid/polyamine antiporter